MREMTNISNIETRPDGSLAVWADKAIVCDYCHEMHYFFVNRDGKVKCVFCDELQQRKSRC